MTSSETAPGVRLDKWLWAARFFKTRSLAKQAIEQGKIRYQGQRPKVSRMVEIDALIEVRRGLECMTLQVLALSEKRGPASVAQGLYQETQASRELREQQAEQRRQLGSLVQAPEQRPDKKSRRQIHRFKRQDLS